MTRAGTAARLLEAAVTPDRRQASQVATDLLTAAWRLQDAGPLTGVDVGLALLVRDQLDRMLGEVA